MSNQYETRVHCSRKTGEQILTTYEGNQYVSFANAFDDFYDCEFYKLNVMSDDIMDELNSRLFPFSFKLYHAALGFALGDAIGTPYTHQEREIFWWKVLTGDDPRLKRLSG